MTRIVTTSLGWTFEARRLSVRPTLAGCLSIRPTNGVTVTDDTGPGASVGRLSNGHARPEHGERSLVTVGPPGRFRARDTRGHAGRSMSAGVSSRELSTPPLCGTTPSRVPYR
ncbi:Hypothetical protein CINCED_3A017162 [Cinara cedri]|uniref:Uncharacterized protein n=1 Tax=Cinara cedri TaxID=506608 RepID=A0A5E4M0W7_9HEMI|nr:Hypothetical protein CINCED_3A017162 [Cinara cedri]